MPSNNGSGNLIRDIEPLLPQAVKLLADYLNNDDTNRGARDRAKIALQIVNTSITLQRAKWTQERHETGIAKLLADGDMDVFQGYIQGAMPGFPQIRKMALPETDGVSQA